MALIFFRISTGCCRLSRVVAECLGVADGACNSMVDSAPIGAHVRVVATFADKFMVVLFQHNRHRAKVNGAAESA